MLAGATSQREQHRLIREAALAYAARGFEVFAAPPGTKKSYWSKDAKDSTGLNWGKTSDPEWVAYYWDTKPNANVCIATGVDSGVFVVETDTAAGHGEGVDGEGELAKLEAKHGRLPDTLTAISPSESKHRYFGHPGDGIKVFSRSAAFGVRGIDVKGDGGMVVAPPSVKPGKGAYRWLNPDTPIAEAPPWLIELVTAPKAAKASPSPGIKVASARKSATASIAPANFDQADAQQVLDDACAELEAEGKGTRNDTLNRIAFFLGQLVGGGRLNEDVVRARLAASAKRAGLEQQETERTIESGVGDGILQPRLLVAEAWQAHLENDAISPPLSPDAGRRQIRRTIERFLAGTAIDRVEAMRATTGLGKTSIAVKLLTEWLKADATRTLLFLVPRHDLGQKVVEQFMALGIDAALYRGREAWVNEKETERMCLNLRQVRIAVAAGMNVEKTCCHYKRKDGSEAQCDYFEDSYFPQRCGCEFQKQFLQQPRVWVAATNLLMFEQRKLFDGQKPSAIIIDEAFWRCGLQSIVMPCDSVSWWQNGYPTPDGRRQNELANKLMRVLDVHAKDLSKNNKVVPLRRSAVLQELSVQDCHDAIALAHKYMSRPKLYPGMPAHEVADEEDMTEITGRYGSRMKIDVNDILGMRKIKRIFEEITTVIEQEIDVSGRLRIVLEKCGNYSAMTEDENYDDGTLRNCQPNEMIPFVHIDGLNPVNNCWRNVPVLIMDATLPGIEILQKYFADVKVVADINIKAEHAHIRQVYNAPVSKKKLKVPAHREMLLRYILTRWFAYSCSDTLVVTQKEFAEWLRDCKQLPTNVFVEHYNAISGRDDYKHVRLLLCIGRTEPTPLAMETDAGALSGAAVESVTGPGDWWYPQVDYELAPGVTVKCDWHPTGLVQEVKYQCCEANIIQASGRARAINRKAHGPVAIEILANVFLPFTLDELAKWQAPGAAVQMLKDYIVVTSPSDMIKVWPNVFKSIETARRALRSFGIEPDDTRPDFPIGNGQFQAFHYQHTGERQKWRRGWHDPAVVPDPAAWLEDRLKVEITLKPS